MIYSAIYNLNTIVADYSDDQGDFQKTCTNVFKANKQSVEFYVIPYMNYDFYFLHKNEYTFASICNQNLDNEKVLIYLQNLKEHFEEICVTEKDSLFYKSTLILKNLMVKIYF